MDIAAVVFVITPLFSAWWVKHNIYASEFRPAKLNAREQKVLDSKLETLKESAQKELVIFKNRVKDRKYASKSRFLSP